MDGEFYNKDGVLYNRPTNILDYFTPPELVDWKVKVGNKTANLISRQALKHGSRIDSLIRANNEPIKKDSDEVKNCWKAWVSWKERHLIGNIVFPETLYCNKRMVAGTPDLYFPEMQELADIKSSKSIHENYFFQLGFYASVLPYPIKRVTVIRLDKTSGVYEYVNNEQVGLSVADCINGFNGLLLYYRAYKRAQSAFKRTGIAQMEEV